MMVKIGVLNLGEILKAGEAASCVESLLELVDSERHARICRFHRIEDRLRSLGAEQLLVSMLRETEGFSEADLPFSYIKGTQGKPLVEGHPEWIWNISHAGELAACVLVAVDEEMSGIAAVGVDVQDWRGIRESVGRRCFTENEISWYRSFDKPEDQEKAFYKLWTLKESFIKTNGMGMTFPMKRAEFTINGDSTGQRQGVKLCLDGVISQYAAAVYDMGLPYGLAVCADNADALFPEKPSWYRMDSNGSVSKCPLTKTSY